MKTVNSIPLKTGTQHASECLRIYLIQHLDNNISLILAHLDFTGRENMLRVSHIQLSKTGL